jgi:hypothetical protein
MPYPMLGKAHRSQFSRALEVAGSTLGERSPSPLRAKTLPIWIARAMFAFPCRAALRQCAIMTGRMHRNKHRPLFDQFVG